MRLTIKLVSDDLYIFVNCNSYEKNEINSSKKYAIFFIPESKPNLPEGALPLSTSLAHAKQRESLPTPDTSPHGHGGHGHAHGVANAAHGHGGQHAHSGHGHGGHGQYGLALGGAGFLSPPALFNIKSEPSSAAGYDSYPHATPPQHYHSHQHYLHALQVKTS